jgi:hypothetical protein
MTAPQCEDCGGARYCPECRHHRRVESVRQAEAKIDRELKRRARHHCEPWKPREDAVAVLSELSIAEIGRKLGRTRAAVLNRRKRLRSR